MKTHYIISKGIEKPSDEEHHALEQFATIVCRELKKLTEKSVRTGVAGIRPKETSPRINSLANAIAAETFPGQARHL